jgi:hypothetical protein
MFVVVALTIVAPVSETTTWTTPSVTDSPCVGETSAITALEEGRATFVVEAEAATDGAGLGLAASAPVAPGAPAAQPATTTAQAMTRAAIAFEWRGIVNLICRA